MPQLSDDDTRTYYPNATDPAEVVAFDTDMTVSYADGPVPLEHVTDLRDDPDVLVWATGHNQTLRDRAGVPGIPELCRLRGMPDNSWVERADRMRLLRQQYPDAETYRVVDDVDLRELEPEWNYYHPTEYVIEVLDFDPSRWAQALGYDEAEYLGRIGSFPGQFPPSDLDLSTEQPYSDRTATGVRTGAREERESRQEAESIDRGSPTLGPLNGSQGGTEPDSDGV